MKVCLVLVAVCLAGVALGQETPKFEARRYEIQDGTGAVCAVYTIAAQFRPTYNRMNNNEPVVHSINLPPLNYSGYSVSVANSQCPTLGESTLVVDFADNQKFTMAFRSEDSEPAARANANWSLTEVEFTYNLGDPLIFPDTNDTGSVTVRSDNVDIGTGQSTGGLYKCNAEIQVNLNATSGHVVPMSLKDALLNPFNDAESGTVECAADASGSSSDDKVVPIAVGCALGGLLLIVIVAFLVGRRTRQRSGYKQV